MNIIGIILYIVFIMTNKSEHQFLRKHSVDVPTPTRERQYIIHQLFCARVNLHTARSVWRASMELKEGREGRSCVDNVT